MTTNQERIKLIKQRLMAELQPSQLSITDDSHLHAGHEGAKSGKGHFTINIQAKAFIDKNKIQQHRLVYAALSDLFETDIHALIINTSTP